MAYAAWSVVFGEQPSATKFNILGSNDASFNTYIGTGTNAIQQFVYSEDGAVATGTTALPFDDSIPQSGEGDQYMSRSITPLSATNILKIDVVYTGSHTAVNQVQVALFQDATASALAASSAYQTTSTGGVNIKFSHMMVAGTTISTTFKVRAGGSTGATNTFNGQSSVRRLGGVMASSISITEYKV